MEEMKMSETKDIIITIVGGCMQWVEGIPEGFRVVVKDYDTDGVDNTVLKRDESGDQYQELIWKRGEDGK